MNSKQNTEIQGTKHEFAPEQNRRAIRLSGRMNNFYSKNIYRHRQNEREVKMTGIQFDSYAVSTCEIAYKSHTKLRA